MRKKKNSTDFEGYLNSITNFRKQNGIGITMIIIGLGALSLYEVVNIIKTIIPLIYIIVVTGLMILVFSEINKRKIIFSFRNQIQGYFSQVTNTYIERKKSDLKNSDDISADYNNILNHIESAVIKEQKAIKDLINKLEGKE